MLTHITPCISIQRRQSSYAWRFPQLRTSLNYIVQSFFKLRRGKRFAWKQDSYWTTSNTSQQHKMLFTCKWWENKWVFPFLILLLTFGFATYGTPQAGINIKAYHSCLPDIELIKSSLWMWPLCNTITWEGVGPSDTVLKWLTISSFFFRGILQVLNIYLNKQIIASKFKYSLIVLIVHALLKSRITIL